MSESSVAIVGSGIAAVAIADKLTRRGIDVVLFEKGPLFPYPHAPQFAESFLYNYANPAYQLPADLKHLTVSGDYRPDLDAERAMVVGGSATHWTAITPRMRPKDFRTRTLFGYGTDWAIDYETLEPYYGQAERLIGVSGTDDDNPFAPFRSTAYPLPPFALSHDDRILAERLESHGIVLHTTPQARTREAYDGRPGCQNFGACATCPIGVRYSPNHHLQRLVATGRCQVRHNTSVRRINISPSGLARSLVIRGNDSSTDEEHAAKLIIVAAGALEVPRLLLLSSSSRHPDGLGNESGHVGRHLVFHHLHVGSMIYKDPLFARRVGPLTGQSDQFRDPEGRARHGGLKVEFSSHYVWHDAAIRNDMTAKQIATALEPMRRKRTLVTHAESVPDASRYVDLSAERDRFGDPFAHVHYSITDFDYRSHAFARDVFERFVSATKAEAVTFEDAPMYSSGAHHMGTCRMGAGIGDSVVNSFGKLHAIDNLFVAGSSLFCGCPGASNPTLTLTALALRTADYLLDVTLRDIAPAVPADG